jgi:chromate transporter
MQCNPPSFPEATRFWIKLGFISFWGPTAQMAMMHEEVVERRQWVSEGEFMKGLQFCMMLPGPEAQQLATYLGWKFHGTRGALVAGILFVLPAVFILWGLSWLYAQWGKSPAIASCFHGLEVAVVALVSIALIKMSPKSLKSRFTWGLALSSLIGSIFLKINFLWFVFGLMGLSFYSSKSEAPSKDQKKESEEDWGQIGIDSLKRFLRLFALCFLPVVLIGFVWGWKSIGCQLGVFFTKAALVTFGGAYSVLPYVAQEAVEKYHWLSSDQMMAGMGLAETTPGPLIMVLQFVGFMAGWQNGGGSSLGLAMACALITTWVTFFPSFLFIFVGGPLLNRLDAFPVWDRFLKWISAVVVGVMGSMAIQFASHVVVKAGGLDFVKIAIVLFLIFGIQRWKWSPLSVVIGSEILGFMIG